MKIAIIGGGIAGLSAAIALKDLDHHYLAPPRQPGTVGKRLAAPPARRSPAPLAFLF